VCFKLVFIFFLIFTTHSVSAVTSFEFRNYLEEADYSKIRLMFVCKTEF